MMLTMMTTTDYRKLIESWPKRWRTRKVLEHPEIIKFLDSVKCRTKHTN